jgi:hypothetical protein
MSLTKKLLYKLNIDPESEIFDKLSEIIIKYVDIYVDKLNTWIELKHMGHLESTKWKVWAFKHPEML